MSGVIKTKADKETYGEKGYGERKYACGLIVPDDGSPEIFYMSRGDAGALLWRQGRQRRRPARPNARRSARP